MSQVVLEKRREAALENGTYRFEKQERELAEERERQQARKAREAETASTNWYAAVDGRIHEHLKSWLWAAIDQRVVQILEQHFFSGKRGVGGAVIGGLTDAVGGIVGKLRAEFKRVVEEERRSFEAKLAEQRALLLASNNPADGAQERAQLRDELKCAFTEMADAFGAQLSALEQRLKAMPGRLPVAKIWLQESVTYEGEFVCHDGALWQACKDTAQTPGGSDWVCVARAGRDAVSPSVRGVYDVHKTYKRLDLVEYDGSGYLARRDAPGVPGIPGEGWQLMSRSGRRGATGETGPRGRKGEQGARGEDGREIVSWHLERETYRAFPIFADGKMGPELNLRPLFERYQFETG
jgi:hypothetical protein